MNLLKSPLRRAAAVTAGAIIGVAGAVTLESPALATHPTVKGEATCVSPDGWKVKWTVTNKWGVDGVIKNVVVVLPVGGTVTGDIQIGATVKKNNGNELVGEQIVPANVEKAKLRVKVDFGYVEAPDAYEVTRPKETCVVPTTPPPSNPPTTPPTTPPTSTPTTPAEPEIPAIGEAKPIFDVDCDTMTIGLDNPKDGVEITLLLSTSKGEKRELTVKPGEKKTTKFSANEDFKLTIGAKGVEETETIAYERPEGCEAGSGGGDGELALTGAAAGSIAGGAGALLALGGVLFFVARRRKVKFTA